MIKRLIKKLHLINPPEKKDRHEVVVMVHGLFLRGLNMMKMGRFLARNGYTVILYDYFTSRKNIAGHGADFEKFLEALAVEKPFMKINIVTHSLGGIITREALGRVDRKTEAGIPSVLKKLIKRIVMLAPPNQGSDVAKKIIKFCPSLGKLVKPLPELCSSPDAYVMKMHVPSGYETGIIAASNDNKVSEESTHLEGEKDHVTVISGHTMIIYGRARKAVLDFLENGKFGNYSDL